MASIFKTNIDNLADAYLKAWVNGNINPYHSGWVPAYTDTSKLIAFTTDPPASHPSNNLTGNITATSVRNAMIFLGTYYANIAQGHYGLWTSNNAPGYWANGGYGFFMLASSAEMQSHLNGVATALQATGTISGPITMLRVQQLYQLAWNAINSRKADVTIELGVCHNSCHNNCHDSRGRR